MKILLIDDSTTMRNLQKSVLAQLGHTEIEEACDGQDGLDKAELFRPDLVLVDWSMPRMHGPTFVRAFRRTNKVTPVIMVSTESARRRVMEAIKAGVNGYVVKPFTPDLLSQRIGETLAKTKAAA